MERKLQFLESFSARGSDGASYKVCGYEHLARDESLQDGREHWEPTGQVEYRLANGAVVTVRRDGTFCVPGSGLELTLPS